MGEVVVVICNVNFDVCLQVLNWKRFHSVTIDAGRSAWRLGAVVGDTGRNVPTHRVRAGARTETAEI